MKIILKLALSAAALCFGLAQTSLADDTPVGNVIEVAKAAGSFKTLLTALDAAKLTKTLETADAVTVFAPTDDAFAALPAGALDSLLANPKALANVLEYHVATGYYTAYDALHAPGLTMLNGQDVSFRFDGKNLFVNDAKVIAYDVLANNGIIHVIDHVLLPPAK